MAWWTALIGPVAQVFTKALDIIDDLVPDKDLAAKLKAALKERIVNIAHTEFLVVIKARSEIILGEVSGHWLQRNWRPILMLVIVAIVANNYILYPYLSMFTAKATVLDLPKELWNLMLVGVGGYIAGRSGEKIVKSLKNNE